MHQAEGPAEDREGDRQEREPHREDEPVAKQGWTHRGVSGSPTPPDIQVNGWPGSVAQVREQGVRKDADGPERHVRRRGAGWQQGEQGVGPERYDASHPQD